MLMVMIMVEEEDEGRRTRSSRRRSWKLKKAAMRILLQTCGSFSRRHPNHPLHTHTNHTTSSVPYDSSDYKNGCSGRLRIFSEMEGTAMADSTPSSASNKNLCAICLDPLNYASGSSPGQAIFTAQCSHSFHFSCISSNVSHGNVTCPICRAHWTQLPRNLIARRAIRRVSNLADPALQVIDDSITTFRVHRRSLVRAARYDDDDPVEPDCTLDHPRLHLSLLPLLPADFSLHQCSYATPCLCHACTSLGSPLSSSSLLVESPRQHIASAPYDPFKRAYLSVTVADQPATDLVLVASPNGPHLRLLKQSMALAVSSLRPIDRLAIVAYSSAAARVFPLRCMTSYGKRAALQVIDRLFYTGQADPNEGLKKGIKILEDRVHRNPHSCILHMSDSPTRSYRHPATEAPVTIHRIYIGFGRGDSNGFVTHEFEEFLARILGGPIQDVKLRVSEGTRIISLGELRGGEERRIPISLNEHGRVHVEYSYVDSTADECRTGEIAVGVADKRERNDDVKSVGSAGGRSSGGENWDYCDPFMARRWAKHLHGYRT